MKIHNSDPPDLDILSFFSFLSGKRAKAPTCTYKMSIIKEHIQKVFCSPSGAEDGDKVLFNSKLPFGTASAIQEETKNNNNREDCNVVARIASCK